MIIRGLRPMLARPAQKSKNALFRSRNPPRSTERARFDELRRYPRHLPYGSGVLAASSITLHMQSDFFRKLFMSSAALGRLLSARVSVVAPLQ